jgi:hypothetical protein
MTAGLLTRLVCAQVAFRLAAVYIDEGAAHSFMPENRRSTSEAVQQLVRTAGDGIPFHTVPLEDIFTNVGAQGNATPQDAQDMLQSLLDVRSHRVCCHVLQQWLIHIRGHSPALGNAAPNGSSCWQAVEDVTGREDLQEALRNKLLLQVAADLHFNKIARGDCATRIAVRTISGSAKGAGYALPASIQHFDGR